MTSISITRALAELKTLDSRIQKTLDNSDFIKVVYPNTVTSLTERDIQSSWSSVNDLISRYEKIKFAIIQSNANTKIKIGPRTYTVAEAIVMKDTIKFRQDLLAKLKDQRLQSKTDISRHESQVQRKLDDLLQINFKERKTSEDDIKVIQEAYLKNNELKVLDPLKLDNKISSLEEDMEEFLKNVDFTLSESNAITTITV